jgi:hypothetical protein
MRPDLRRWAHGVAGAEQAEERGRRDALEAEFPLLRDQFLVDSLVWCDMTTMPGGEPTTAGERMAEIVSRYGADSLVGRFIRRASPLIFATVARVNSAVADQAGAGSCG